MPPKSFPEAYTDVLLLNRTELIFLSGLCFFSIPRSSQLQDIAEILHPDELAYFRTLQFEKRRKNYLIGRYAAKQAIAVLTGERDVRNIAIEHGIFNQPIVSHASRGNVQTSITHCDDIGAALAFPESHPMGIDVEKIDIRRLEVMESQFTKKECELYNPLWGTYEEFATLLWTAKEALSKTLKTGFTAPFPIYEIGNVEAIEGAFLIQFGNFCQYAGLFFRAGDYACTIVHPRKTRLNIEADKIRNYIQRRTSAAQ